MGQRIPLTPTKVSSGVAAGALLRSYLRSGTSGGPSTLRRSTTQTSCAGRRSRTATARTAAQSATSGPLLPSSGAGLLVHDRSHGRTRGPAPRWCRPSVAAACEAAKPLIARDLALNLACVDLATPGPGLGAARLNVLLEALQVPLDTARQQAHGVPHAFRGALRGVLQLQLDARRGRSEGLEGHNTGVRGPGGAAPGHPLVRYLLDDLGVPFLSLAADVGAPMQALIVKLPDLLDRFHKARELFELGPLVVGRAQRHVDLDRLLYLGHTSLLCLRPSHPCTVGAARQLDSC